MAGIILIYSGISTIFSIGFRLTLGPFVVFPPDIIFVLVAGGAFVRILGLPRLNLAQVAVFALGCLALFSVARGAAVDIASAVTEFRTMFYFISGALYFVTVEPTAEFLDKVSRLFYATALLILAGTIVLWGQFLTGRHSRRFSQSLTRAVSGSSGQGRR